MHGVLLDTSADTTQWAPIAVVLLAVIYIAFVRPMQKRKKDPLARKPAETTLAQQRAVERDMTALLVEYEKMMRTMTTQIENRAVKLELLIRDADDRLGQLRQVSEYVSGLAAGVIAKRPSTSDVVSRPQATTTTEIASTPLTASGAGEAATPAESPRHHDVYALADEGLSYRQIARRLDRPDGEIELILALRPKPTDLQATQPEPEPNSSAAEAQASAVDVADSNDVPPEPTDPVHESGCGDGPHTSPADEPANSDDDVRREAELAVAAAQPSAAGYSSSRSHEQRRKRKKRR